MDGIWDECWVIEGRERDQRLTDRTHVHRGPKLITLLWSGIDDGLWQGLCRVRVRVRSMWAFAPERKNWLGALADKCLAPLVVAVSVPRWR